MSVEVTRAVIKRFLAGPKSGNLVVEDGRSFRFGLDQVKDGALRSLLSSLQEPETDVAVRVTLHRLRNSVDVVMVSPTSDTPLVDPNLLPAQPGPFRDAKQAFIAKNYRRAEELYLDAIRSGDRSDSAVKDLATMLSKLGRAEEAVILLTEYLASAAVTPLTRPPLSNLRANIQGQLSGNSKINGTAAGFKAKVRGIVSATMGRSAPLATPPVQRDLHGVQTKLNVVPFLALEQNGHLFPILPWAAAEKGGRVAYPTHPSFDAKQPFALARTPLELGTEVKALPAATPGSTERLAGAWVLPVPAAEWKRSIQVPCDFNAEDAVYFRDEKMLGGPWQLDEPRVLYAVNGDHVYEWPWDETGTLHLEFADRMFLLHAPAEEDANLFDFAEEPELMAWLKGKLLARGPEVRQQFDELLSFCTSAFTSPLDVSRWARVEALLGPACGSTPNRPRQVSADSSLDFLRDVLGPNFPQQAHEVPEALHLGTLSCRCLLVPSPHLSRLYCECIETSLYALVTASPMWLSFSDCWAHVEYAWNLAHQNPDTLVLIHIEEVQSSLVRYWAKPLLNVAQGLCESLVGYTDLPWPGNLRVHLSLSEDDSGFPLPEKFRAAFGAVPRGAVVPATSTKARLADGSVWMEWAHSMECTACDTDSFSGDFAHRARLELAQLRAHCAAHQLPESLADQIRVEIPQVYWEAARGSY